jgi:hypothetical protein
MIARSAAVKMAMGLLVASGCGITQVAPATDPLPDPSGRFEVLGRGPVTHTHSSGLAVFRGVNGRDYAYTGTWGDCSGCVGNRIYVWDVTEPASPVLTDSVVVDARIIHDIRVNEDRSLAIASRQGASTRRDGVVLLGLVDPAHPTIVTEYWETLTGGVRSISLDGNLLYAVNMGTDDMHVIDMSNPADPVQISRWGVPAHPMKHLRHVSVAYGLAFLSYWDDGLIIVDVGNGVRNGTPQSPQYVSQFRYRTEIQGREFGNTNVAVPYTNEAGNMYVFVADEIVPSDFDIRRPQSSPLGQIRVLDLRNVAAPVEVAQYRLPRAGPGRFWIENDVLYVGHYNAGLRAVDISGTLRGDLGQQGREIAAVSTADGAAFVADRPFTWDVRPHGGSVFALDFNSGLWATRLEQGPAGVN